MGMGFVASDVESSSVQSAAATVTGLGLDAFYFCESSHGSLALRSRSILMGTTYAALFNPAIDLLRDLLHAQAARLLA